VLHQASITGMSYNDAPSKGVNPFPRPSLLCPECWGLYPESPCPGGRVTFVMRNPDASDQAMTPACGRWPDLERRSKMPDGPTLFIQDRHSCFQDCLDRLAGAGSSPSEGSSHGQCKMPPMYCISHHLVSSGTTSTRTSTSTTYVVVTDGWRHRASSPAYSYIPHDLSYEVLNALS